MKPLLLALAALGHVACGDAAPPPREQSVSSLRIEHAWAAPTPGGVDVSAGYLSIINETSTADRLVSAESPRAAQVDVHEMSMEGGVMRMRATDGLDIPAGGEVTLEPGGFHLMFTGVTQPFTEGEEIPVRLTFEHAGAVDISLPVRRETPASHNMVGKL